MASYFYIYFFTSRKATDTVFLKVLLYFLGEHLGRSNSEVIYISYLYQVIMAAIKGVCHEMYLPTYFAEWKHAYIMISCFCVLVCVKGHCYLFLPPLRFFSPFLYNMLNLMLKDSCLVSLLWFLFACLFQHWPFCALLSTDPSLQWSFWMWKSLVYILLGGPINWFTCLF